MQHGVTLTQNKDLRDGTGREWDKTKQLTPTPSHPTPLPFLALPSAPVCMYVCMYVYIYIYFFVVYLYRHINVL